jgi:hypothetical protein
MQLDEQIRDALACEASTIPAEAVERLRRIDYRPRRRAVWSPLAAGALATASAATAGTLLVLGGTGSQEAFAGWSARPTSTRVGHASTVETKCATRIAEASRLAGGPKSGVSSTEPLLADTRGPYTLILYPHIWCFSGPDFISLRGVGNEGGVSISTAYRDGGHTRSLREQLHPTRAP